MSSISGISSFTNLYTQTVKRSNDSSEDPFENALDSLVSDGTITQEQEDAIAAALQPFNLISATDSYLEMERAMESAASESAYSAAV